MSASDDNIKTAENNADESLSPAYAVALGYDPARHNAPTVLAKGQGQIAEKIIQIALDEGIEIQRPSCLFSDHLNPSGRRFDTNSESGGH